MRARPAVEDTPSEKEFGLGVDENLELFGEQLVASEAVVPRCHEVPNAEAAQVNQHAEDGRRHFYRVVHHGRHGLPSQRHGHRLGRGKKPPLGVIGVDP